MSTNKNSKKKIGRITKHARQLRQKSTFEEKAFWFKVRNRRFNGLKFYRQYPIIYTSAPPHRYFIADFYCHEKKLVIELDGIIHLSQQEYDANRDAIMHEMGIKVLRIQNDVMKDWFKVKDKILSIINEN